MRKSDKRVEEESRKQKPLNLNSRYSSTAHENEQVMKRMF
jgi:hypothetical protein